MKIPVSNVVLEIDGRKINIPMSRSILEIVDIILTEEMTAEDYVKVVRNIIPANVVSNTQASHVFSPIVKWAMEHLKKNNRIIWFLRWYALRITYSTFRRRNAYDTYDKMIPLFGGLAAKAGMDLDKFIEVAEGMNLDELLPRLEHFFNEHTIAAVPKIRNYSFQWQTPDQVLSDLEKLEEEVRVKQGGIDPKVLIRPDQFEKNAEKLVEFPDGWAWFKLHTHTSKEESRSGNNCGTCELGESTLLSLRRPIKIGKETWWKSELTAELTADNKIRQLRHGNEKPDDEYHPYIMKLLLMGDIDGFELPEYQPKDTFYVEDLSDNDKATLEAESPDLLKDPEEGRSRISFEMWDPIAEDNEYLGANDWEEAIKEARGILKGLSSDILVTYSVVVSERDNDGETYGDEFIGEWVGSIQDVPDCIDKIPGKDTHDFVNDDIAYGFESIRVDICGRGYEVECKHPQVCRRCGTYVAMVDKYSKIRNTSRYASDEREIKRQIEIEDQPVFKEADETSEAWVENLREK